MPKTRRWNINEAEGRYAATNLPETAVDLHLGMKRLNGEKVPLGRYDLDLAELAQQGFVTRRQVGGTVVYDVQVYRESDGTLLLGVRRDRTTRLERFQAEQPEEQETSTAGPAPSMLVRLLRRLGLR